MHNPEIMEPVTPVRPRFTEPLKFLPVAFMSGTMIFLYLVYVLQHCVPRMQLDVEAKYVDADIRQRGQLEFLLFHAVTAMVVVCYLRAIFTSAGSIPDGDRHWEYVESSMASFLPSFLIETKRTGDRRHCKWCSKFKPDRTHHCRVCRTCTLKMDHHCPWIYNCVGYFNYKYFFLLLLYSAVDCHLITITMAETVVRTTEVPTPFFSMFVIFFAATLAALLGLLITLFFGFHCYLIAKGMSTIEFCEKHLPKPDGKPVDTSLYDAGLSQNIRAVLGNQAVLWLLPVGGPSGDGLNFATVQIESRNKTPIRNYDDLEATKQVNWQRDRKRFETGICDDAETFPGHQRSP
mmetsp:Transcript_42275/g.78688  ORF Transcript_42275/g.78688 Transcript_42275/m.78688 type:complete len:348 (-) Transcript_42275:138-1181(-)